jgi:acetylornithine deacetylase/succinyl-diaminopimelate desuccinylase-like protein
MLIYGHYDVQPVNPLSAWATDPFRPVVVGRHLYGRGASDDKGQLFAHFAALEAWLAGTGRLPVTVRIVLDGEEEIGSPTLLSLAARRDPLLAYDVVVVSDTRMRSPHQPIVVTGLRGMVKATLEVDGARRDLHVGAFAGAVPEPARVLGELIASLHDREGRVAVAGFYDDVRRPRPTERSQWRRDAPGERALLAAAGVERAAGEPGWTAFERTACRPVIAVADLGTSAHGRTVVPAQATASLNVRLVPEQRPQEVIRLLHRHLNSWLPPGVRARLRIHRACPPFRLDSGAAVITAAVRACCRVFGRRPLLLPSGGSIPLVSVLAEQHGPHVLLLGFGLPNDGIHAANERMYLPNLIRGTAACIELYGQLGTLTTWR